MTFSYTAGSGTDRDRIRFRIGDTDPLKPVQERLEDAEIDDALVTEGGWLAAAAVCAYSLAGKFATKATSKRMGQASLEWKKFEYLTALATSLRASVSFAAIPFAGGISKALKNTNAQDTDSVVPSFTKGMLDNPPSTQSTST